MAQKLNLDFSIGESIVNVIKSTAELKIGSININTTNVPLATEASNTLETSNKALMLVTKNVESVKKNYEIALESFKDIQDKSSKGIGLNISKNVISGINNRLSGVKK